VLFESMYINLLIVINVVYINFVNCNLMCHKHIHYSVYNYDFETKNVLTCIQLEHFKYQHILYGMCN
jgi:hypothetical protein